MSVRFRKAVLADWKALLDWRNDPVSRANSLTNDRIEEEAHKNWFTRSLANPDREILIMVDGDLDVGMLRFDVFEDGYRLSWMVAPSARGQGYGRQLLPIGLQHRSGIFYAEIIASNAPSRAMAEKAGFTLLKTGEDFLTYQKINP